MHFMDPDRKMTCGHHMSDAGIFVRPCSKSRGWVIHSLRSRKVVVSRNASVVRDPNTRHAQLALSGDLIGRHGPLDTSPDAYRANVRALFASHLGAPLFAPLIADDPLAGVPVADEDGDRVLVSESAWPSLDARPDLAIGPSTSSPAFSSARCTVTPPPALNAPGTHDLCAHEPNLVAFAPLRGSCHVNAVPDGAVSLQPWLCSLLLLLPGSPLPRAIRLGLRQPGDALFYMHGCVRPDG